MRATPDNQTLLSHRIKKQPRTSTIFCTNTQTAREYAKHLEFTTHIRHEMELNKDKPTQSDVPPIINITFNRRTTKHDQTQTQARPTKERYSPPPHALHHTHFPFRSGEGSVFKYITPTRRILFFRGWGYLYRGTGYVSKHKRGGWLNKVRGYIALIKVKPMEKNSKPAISLTTIRKKCIFDGVKL